MELAGKVAVVTGGAVRVGRTLVQSLAQRGVKTCLHYGRSSKEAAEIVRIIQTSGGSAIAVQADLTEPVKAAQKIIAFATDEFGHVDFLINNAAIFEEETLEKASETSWDRHFDINLKTPFFLCQAFAAQLATDQQGQIINMLDWRSLRPGPDYIIYTLTKNALAALTRSLAQTLGPTVRVNGIAPGAILPTPEGSQKDFEGLAQEIPLQRTGSPSNLAQALLFLLQSDFINGEILHVTGGQHL